MPLIADAFPKAGAAKKVVKQMSKDYCFRAPLDRQHNKWVETLLISERQHLYNIY